MGKMDSKHADLKCDPARYIYLTLRKMNSLANKI